MDLRWYWERLRLMSVAELGVRAMRRVTLPLLISQLRQSNYSASLRSRSFLPFETAELDTLRHPVLIETANRVLRGERWVLGLGWLGPGHWDWHQDPKSGYTWPAESSHHLNHRKEGTEIRLCWELNRFHDLTVLAQAYWLTGLSQYIDTIRELFDRWVEQNPVGIGPNWISPMEAAIRVVNMTWVARMIHATDEDLVKRLGRQVYIHERWVAAQLSVGSSANNHLLVELMGIVYAHAFWDLHPDELWKHTTRFTRELDAQLGPDGMHSEMSTHYHLFVAECAVHVSTALQARGLNSPALQDALDKMRIVAEALTIQEGICKFGDDDDGAVIRWPDSVFRWDHVIAGLRSSPWVPLQKPGVKPTQAQWLDGILVVRHGRFRTVVDAGPHGLPPLFAHGHDDSGNVWIGYDGQWLVVDPGTAVYFGDFALRQNLCGAPAHNWPQLVGAERAGKLHAPFLWESLPETVEVITYRDLSDVVAVEMTRDSIKRNIKCYSWGIKIIDMCDNQESVIKTVVNIASAWQIEKFDTEGIMYSAVDHPKVHMRGTRATKVQDSLLYMRFADGGTLSTCVQYQGPPTIEWGFTACQ